MSAKKSQSQKKFEKSMKDMSRGIPVEKSKVKKPFRKKLMGIFAGTAMIFGGANMFLEDAPKENQTSSTQITQSQSPLPNVINTGDARITSPLYDFNLNRDFNQTANPHSYWDMHRMNTPYQYRDRDSNRPVNSTSNVNWNTWAHDGF